MKSSLQSTRRRDEVLKIHTCVWSDKVSFCGRFNCFELFCYSPEKPIILHCINSLELKNKYMFKKIPTPGKECNNSTCIQWHNQYATVHWHMRSHIIHSQCLTCKTFQIAFLAHGVLKSLICLWTWRFHPCVKRKTYLKIMCFFFWASWFKFSLIKIQSDSWALKKSFNFLRF